MATAERAGSGRRSARRAYWRRQVDAHRRSGLSQVAFCAQRSLRKGTLSFWKWKFAREARLALRRSPPGARRSTTVPPFIPIQLAPPRPPRGAEPTPVLPDRMEVEIALGPDRCLRVRGRVDPAWLVQVLRGLEGRRC